MMADPVPSPVPQCPHERAVRRGAEWRAGKRMQRWQCSQCGYLFISGTYPAQTRSGNDPKN